MKHITEHQTQDTASAESGAQAQQNGEGKEEQARNAADLEAGRTADEILLTRSLGRELGLDRETDKRE